ncbi:MAG: hypothetical protein QOH63_1960 [Acidobacteriota bacterium]|nr:hypothetical protein [Acidobacteriota bacterium]
MAEEIKTGTSTSEFMLTGAGMTLSALLALLAAFNVLTLTELQKIAIFAFAGACWTYLPAAYAKGRSLIKAAAVAQPQMILQNKQVTEEKDSSK